MLGIPSTKWCADKDVKVPPDSPEAFFFVHALSTNASRRSKSNARKRYLDQASPTVSKSNRLSMWEWDNYMLTLPFSMWDNYMLTLRVMCWVI